MAWEKRKRGGAYYVTKFRVGNKVYSRYVGTGEEGRLCSQMQALFNEKALCRLEKIQAQRAEYLRRESIIRDYRETVRSAFVLHMEAAGYHYHRGEWRKRRGDVLTASQRQKLINKAYQGDRAAADTVRADFETAGGGEQFHASCLCHYFGYAPARSGSDVILEQTIKRHTAKLFEEFTQEGDTVLERQLIRQIIACWFILQDAQRALPQKLQNGGSVPVENAYYLLRAHDNAQKRYLAAVRELGLARRLRVPKREADEQAARLRMLPGGKAPGPVEIEEAA